MRERTQEKESVRLTLPGGLGPDCLRGGWSVECHPQQSRDLDVYLLACNDYLLMLPPELRPALQDASVQQRSLLEYRERKKAGAAVALGLGGLVSILYQRQQQSRALIVQALEEVSGAATAQAFKRSFKTHLCVS